MQAYTMHFTIYIWHTSINIHICKSYGTCTFQNKGLTAMKIRNGLLATPTQGYSLPPCDRKAQAFDAIARFS